MAYKLLNGGGVLRTDDGASIPPDPANADWQRFLADQAGGATVQPADPAPIVYAGQAALSNRVRTTNAAPTEIYRATLAQVTGYRARLTLNAVDAGNGAVRFIEASICAKRLAGGALLVGTVAVIADHADAAASTWTAVPSVNGNDFVVTITGAAGRTIDWLLAGSVVSFTPGGA